MERSARWAETGVGAAVLALAALFLIYALSHAQGGFAKAGGYELNAKFGQVGALAPGADVRVAGVKVGSVTRIELDPKTFLARTRMTLDPGVKLPEDSTAKITSDSLLGGQHVAIEPGGAAKDLAPGAEFQNTQGSVDLFGLIGQFVRGSGSTPAASGAGGTPPAAPAAPAPGAGQGASQGADPYPAGAQ